ncbi:iron complex outermembrane receptor protein [Wenyingzhuangia heitensis]|uniref:Iron complex outermembrane receptor protein n=1 Tax=Wenyingzhuangia heitensis TaxID=1487859 RepID=A0ABX0U5U4_9FLAO|nr:TonB-dependent receptor [Wenyingzhuangia heitensis]NIJ43734.1 iron complex outermembrane receptor protein [Wenyingzhuangia heitensis]
MKLNIWIAMLSIVFCANAFAQKSTLKIKVIDAVYKEPVLGATVLLQKTNFVDITDVDGEVVLNTIPVGDYLLKVSFLGYETYQQKVKITSKEQFVNVVLEAGNEELESIIIKASRSTRTVQDIPTRIEFVGGEELGEKAMMNGANISMVLRESNGIQIQQTSLSSGNTSIKIQGLDGRYTQLLKDGFPMYGGFSGGLSLMQIPPLDLAQFEIIKGSSSTLYGGGAIAGLVNMVSKTPGDEATLDVLLTQTHVGGSTANVFYSDRQGKIGYTLYGSGNYQNIYDPNNDDFSNLPQTRTVSFNPKIFYYPNKATQFWLGLNATFDERKGGDVSVINNGVNGMHTYKEINESKRGSTQAVFEHQFNEDENLTIKQSVSYYDRVLTTSDLVFSGSQLDVFSEVNYQIHQQNNDWVLGTNYYQNSFDEDRISGDRNQNKNTLGTFVNNTHDFSKQFVLETGLRADYSYNYGVFVLPRVSLLWNKNRKFSTRLGGGLGYKLPDMFSEEAAAINFKNVLKIDNDLVNAETSYGGNWDLNYKTKLSPNIGFSWNQLFYVTGIDDALVLETDNNNVSQFVNANGFVLSRGAESNIKFTYKDLKWFLSYAYNNTTLNYLAGNPQKSLTPKHSSGSVFMYENETWRAGFETYYTGKQNLSNGTRTTDYVLFGFLLQRHFSWGSPYVNFENFTDVRQSKFSSEVSGTHSNPIFNEIYAPTDGFILSVGIKFSPFGGEEHHH